MTDEKPQNYCCVCGREVPRLPVKDLVARGAAIVRETDGQLICFCIGRHTKKEIEMAMTGAPTFRRASDLPRSAHELYLESMKVKSNCGDRA